MRRALSAEHIAEVALSTLEGLKRFIPRRNDAGNIDETEALPLMCKTLDEKAMKCMKLEPSELTQLMEMFSEEVQYVCDTPSFAPGASPGSPVGASENGAKRASTIRKTYEALAYCLHVMAQLYDASPSTVAQVMDANDTPNDILLLMSRLGSPMQIVEPCWNVLLRLFSGSPLLFSGACHAIAEQLRNAQSLAPAQLSSPLAEMRLLFLLHCALRLADVTPLQPSSDAKRRLVGAGVIQLLLARAHQMHDEYNRNKGQADPKCLATGLLSLMVVGGLFRGVPAHKEAASQAPELVHIWSFYASNIERVECRQSAKVTVLPSKDEEQVFQLENTSIWACDLVEFWMELATADSISLRRQEVALGASTAADQNPSLSSVRGGSFSPKPPRPHWEPWTPNMELLLSSASMTPWRLAAAVYGCLLSVSSAELLLKALLQLNIATTHAANVYRGVIATVLLLCRACPLNSATLSKAGAFQIVISLMTPHSAVFDLQEKNVTPVVSASEFCWNITSALLATLCASYFGREQLRIILAAIERMIVVDYASTTPEDCSVIEQCACVLSSAVYPRYTFWFDGVSSRFVLPIDRFCGRWFGYSFTCWVCTSCVWPEGAVLYAHSETSTPSDTALCIVANANSKCLAIRSTHSKEVVIAVLPDTTLAEGWNHIVAVHNISGYTVFVNGKKACSTSVNYPKEPPKPHRLTFCVGGAEKETNIPSVFGSIASIHFLEGAIQEKDIDRLVQAGPGAVIEPPVGNAELLSITPTEALEVTGSLAKPELTSAPGVLFSSAPRVSEAMIEEELIRWAIDCLVKLPKSANRSSVIILCIQMVAAFLKQHRGAVPQWADSNGPGVLSAIVLHWTVVPPEVVCSLFLLITQEHDSKLLRQHQSTAATLTLILDVVCENCPPVTKSTAFRELSDCFNIPENAKLARENPGFPALMDCCRGIEPECIDDFIAVVEKLVKEANEMDYLFKWIILEATSPRTTIVTCELLRMLYDIAKPQQQIVDLIANVGGVQNLMVVISNTGHSESLQVYALRLLALILHCNRKQRDLFLRNCGFDMLTRCLSCQRQQGIAPLGLPTYNALFKFSLDFFQPSNDPRGNVLCDASARRPTPHAMFAGQMPSMVPRASSVMQRAVSLNSMTSSDCNDLEARLSVDDAYNSRAIARDTLVYPQCLATILELLGESISLHSSAVASQYTPAVSCADSTCPDAIEGNSEIVSSSNDVSSTQSSSGTIAIKVLSYLDRMVDLTRNAIALLPYTWLEWLWSGVSPILFTEDFSKFDSSTVQRIDILVRSIIRKIAVVDLSQSPKQSYTKKFKEMVDLKPLQCMLLEEIVRHFSQPNRLSLMDEISAGNCLRNLDVLLQNVDESVFPIPRKLSFELADAISTIAVHSSSWVRNKMKSGKLFEIRNGLSFIALVATKELERDTPETLEALAQSNAHDVNASLHLLKLLCDAVREKSVERVDAVEAMIRFLFAHDDDHRKAITKVALEPDILEVIVQQRRVIENTEVEADNVVFWSVTHEARWEQFVQRVMKAYRGVESDLTSRTERREKEQQSRLKARKAETEKRHAAAIRLASDVDKLKAEWAAKQSAYTEAVKELAVARSVRLQRALAAEPSAA